MTNGPQDHPHELISALLDGEATVPERAAVEVHLRDCAECRALLGDLRILAATGASLQTPPVPAGLLAAVRARLEAIRGGPGGPAAAPALRWWAGMWRSPLPVAAAAGLMVVLATVWLLREGAGPMLQAPRPRPIELDEEVRADRIIPAVPEDAAAPEEKRAAQDSPPPSRSAAPRPVSPKPVPTPPPTGMMRQEPPLPSPSSEAIAVLPPVDEGSGTAGAAPRAADLAREIEGARATPRKPKAASPLPEAVLEFAAAGAQIGEERELQFELPDYSGWISEGGTITLKEGDYRCALEIGDSPEIRAQVASLFTLASPAALQEAGENRPVPEGAVKAGARGRITVRTTGAATARSVSIVGASHDLPSASVDEIGRRIRELIQGPLRGPLEDRCGPLPKAGGHDPAD